jgi:hypothetical protein
VEGTTYTVKWKDGRQPSSVDSGKVIAQEGSRREVAQQPSRAERDSVLDRRARRHAKAPATGGRLDDTRSTADIALADGPKAMPGRPLTGKVCPPARRLLVRETA